MSESIFDHPSSRAVLGGDSGTSIFDHPSSRQVLAEVAVPEIDTVRLREAASAGAETFRQAVLAMTPEDNRPLTQDEASVMKANLARLRELSGWFPASPGRTQPESGEEHAVRLLGRHLRAGGR